MRFFKVGIGSTEDLELLILELLSFGGFSAHFDPTDINQRKLSIYTRLNPLPRVDSSSMSLLFRAESHSSGGFLIPEL
jgi:hypothetical protein